MKIRRRERPFEGPTDVHDLDLSQYINGDKTVLPEASDFAAIARTEGIFDRPLDDESDVHPFQRCAVLDQYQYLNQERAGRRAVGPPSSGLAMASRIDEIDPNIVARANIISLESAHYNNELAKQRRRPDLLRPAAEVEKERARRGLSAEPKLVSKIVAAALRHLTEVSQLYFGATQQQVANGQIHGTVLQPPKASPSSEPLPPLAPTSSAGAFFIQKSNGMLRTITDGRWANLYFLTKTTAFNFFTPECLKAVMANLRFKHAKRTWYAVNLDIRHMFHQLPLPAQYRRFLGIKVPDRNNSGWFWLFPFALPMGWVLAPFVAQCVTWSTILGKATKGNAPGHSKFDLPPRSFLAERTTPFAWLPFTKGGGIFVVLDNALFVTPERAVAEAWFQKMVMDCEHHNIMLKGSDKQDIAERTKELREKCFHIMKADDNTHFEFLGVKWYHDGLEVVPKEVEENTLEKNIHEEHGWNGTRRDMASILGKLNWFRRLHGITNHDPKYSRLTEAMFDIYSKITPASKEGWNDSFVYVNCAHLKAVDEVWRFRATVPRCPLMPTQIQLDPTKVGYAITDSATRTQLCAAIAYGFENLSFECPETAEKFHMLTQTGEFGKRIALGELEAIVIAVEFLVDAGKTLIILGTDNMNCKHWLEGSPAHDPRVRELLSRIFAKLGSEVRLYVTYIPTDDNFTDELSRKLELVMSKLKKNHILLNAARNEAEGYWNIAGLRTGGTGSDIKLGRD